MIKKTRGTNAGGTALKILIIEDEQLLADSIAEVLRRKGFEAEAVYDGETGAEYAELGVYDLLILDVMMPGLDGYTVARQVRARHLGTPILMLTARSGLEDRITGLNAGADYYLTKPFDTRELLACVNALLRRQGAQVNQLTLGNTSLDLSTAALSCGADSIRLSAREFTSCGCSSRRASAICPRRPCWSGYGGTTPTRWKTMWRSTSAFCGKSSPASAPTSALSPSAGWATTWR